MRTSEMKVTGSESKRSVILQGPDPETIAEMSEICRDGETGALSLAIQAWRVAVANPIRRAIDAAVAADHDVSAETLTGVAQGVLSGYRYGERVAGAPKVKSVKITGRVSQSLLEQLAAQGVVVEIAEG